MQLWEPPGLKSTSLLPAVAVAPPHHNSVTLKSEPRLSAETYRDLGHGFNVCAATELQYYPKRRRARQSARWPSAAAAAPL